MIGFELKFISISHGFSVVFFIKRDSYDIERAINRKYSSRRNHESYVPFDIFRLRSSTIHEHGSLGKWLGLILRTS